MHRSLLWSLFSECSSLHKKKRNTTLILRIVEIQDLEFVILRNLIIPTGVSATGYQIIVYFPKILVTTRNHQARSQKDTKRR